MCFMWGFFCCCLHFYNLSCLHVCVLVRTCGHPLSGQLVGPHSPFSMWAQEGLAGLDCASWTVHPGLCFASQHISPLCHFSSFMSLYLYLGPNTPSKHPGTGTKYTVLGRHVRDTFYTEYKCTPPLPRNSKQPFVIWLRAGRGANNGNPRPYLVSSSSFSHPPLFLPLLLTFSPSF